MQQTKRQIVLCRGRKTNQIVPKRHEQQPSWTTLRINNISVEILGSLRNTSFTYHIVDTSTTHSVVLCIGGLETNGIYM